MTNHLTERTLSDLAFSLPGSAALFHDYKLDFCCAGQRSLRDAANEQGLDAERIAEELLALPPAEEMNVQWIDWRLTSNDQLIDHILERYHTVHRQQLPALIPLAERVEKTHAAHPLCPVGLTAHLKKIQEELEWHMCKEESVLFPWLRQGIPLTHVQGPIGVMRHEHDEHSQSLAVLADLTDDLTVPADGCNSWRRLYSGLEELRRDLMQHIHLENNLLFLGANHPA
ncbi:iron-sulfur cluster repair protein YtfE [Pseudomonas sp. GD04087]|nr:MULTISPECIES: iron-sulfur cluster repair protein YtfE [Pseudomonas]MCP1648289.1 regulator of cell morphogenesis and NO signaling [Pseudomonas nitroreducens]MCP1686864.1 regulator of cell morphogenesis and NO signaling [Pseudomonas nitroreducens]MDH0288715.1 iron-sulfur cluster repair protein YtfE [Pseudomonas sp. GD04087]MDH1050714.1 iron-sulfur cluster repair protein YtfE [Pseudomonas sp. GD03903]MDH1999109.1 iron-sulfur cluster repair protein YtfE [Pseudomonas sp. GD03691]